ncbi:MFS transporter [Parahaliea mediterranea]|uniref:MFS transporter n=1 Tax=Parahaliea mediterranea TaxID=651086 RepID=A0A939IP20_9GAMM|nr:MFS transporter [Parahaliea mediterranea]MBN7799140.1 MFS transporter [Parahaliea mediterranea]
MSYQATPGAAAPPARRFPTAAANGEIARVLLAFLATAGLFYVNIMPALVDGLIGGLGFSNREAGFVGSANVYGAALGALTAVFVVKRLPWRPCAVTLLLGLITIDFASMLLESAWAMIALRFVHGCVGGALVGVGFAVISRTTQADRTFGYLLTVQFGLGGLGLMYLPGLVPDFGVSALFLALIAFSVVTLLMVPFLDDYPVARAPVAAAAQGDNKSLVSRRGLLTLTLAATFLFQAANMAIYAYIIGMGRFFGLDSGFISSTLGFAAWIAISGSVAVILLSTRYGRLLPVAGAIALTVAGTWILHYSDVKALFWVANVGVGITWAFVISYLLGMCSTFDASGQAAALGGFASKMGLASGPMIGALVLGENNYALLINLSVLALVLSLICVLVPARVLDRHT